MKKVLVGITAAVCAAVMCVGLVACGPNAKDVKSIEVTEAEWNTALAYLDKKDAEYSIQDSSDLSAKYGEKSITITHSNRGRVKDRKAYIKMTANVSGNGIGDGEGYLMSQKEADEMKKGAEKYSVVERTTTYVYEKNDEGKWGKSTGYNVIQDIFSDSYFYLYFYLHIPFSSYEYNEEEKGYVLTSSTASSDSATVVLKFGKVGDDVRLVAVYTYGEGLNGGNGIEFTKIERNVVFTYTGVADITLPEVD